MSNGVNHVILVGHLGADPELKSTPSGRQVAEFRMATSRKWSDAQGQAQEATEWHRVKVWGRMAESVGRFLSKGRQVYVEGRIESRKWVDKEGHDRTAFDIVARQVVFLGGGRQGQQGQQLSRMEGSGASLGLGGGAGRYGAPSEDLELETEPEEEMSHGVLPGFAPAGPVLGPAQSPYPAASVARPAEPRPGEDKERFGRRAEGEAWSRA